MGHIISFSWIYVPLNGFSLLQGGTTAVRVEGVVHMRKRKKQSKAIDNPGQLEFCWCDEFMAGEKVSSKSNVILEENDTPRVDDNQKGES